MAFSERLIRSLLRSTSSTCTSISSSTLTTEPGWSTCFQESSETWIRPSMPPRSTKAPKLTTLDTMPLRISPGRRLWRNSSLFSFWVSSNHARRDSTTLLRFLSSSMILASMVVPMKGCRSRTRRRSTRDAGRKPRRPMSTMRPPLTTSMTVPETIPSPCWISSIRPQARSYWARFLERTRRPSLSSRCSTTASMRSPRVTISLGSTPLRIDSSRGGITPSDL